MKKKFYNVGSYINTRYQKNGAEVGIALGIGALTAGLIGSSVAADSNESINAQNIKMAKENNALSEKLFYEGNEFNAEQAQIARDYNSKEAGIARDFNAEQAAVNREFMASQFEKAMQYNSIGEQVKRARDHGINPAAVLGGSSTPVTSIPSGSTASASAASIGSPSSQGVPSLQLPNLHSNAGIYSNLLNNITSSIGDVVGSVSEVNKNTNQLTLNQFTKYTKEAGLKLTEAQTAKIYADIKQSQQYIDVMKNDIERIKSLTNVYNNEAVNKAIESKWKDEELQSMIKKNLSDAGWNEQQINYYKQLLPVQLGLYRSQSVHNIASAALADAQKGLTNEQIEQVRAVASLIQTQGKQALLDYTVNRTFQMKNAKEGYYQNKARTDQMEYAADDVVQILGTTSEVLSSVAGAAASVTAAGAASKYIMSGAKKAIPETGIKAGNWKPRQQLYY